MSQHHTWLTSIRLCLLMVESRSLRNCLDHNKGPKKGEPAIGELSQLFHLFFIWYPFSATKVHSRLH
jgi:hypothetical protein